MMSVNEDKSDSVSSKRKIVLEIDEFPFKGLKISGNWEKLDSVENRTICSLCKKSRKYFCYTCYVAVPEIHHLVPKVKLPVNIDIIKHAREMDGKSTAVHAAVLAPENVKIFTYPSIPDYDPCENVVLIFPNKDAVTVEEICERFFRKGYTSACKRPCLKENNNVVHRAVFIDSTWNQSRGIFKDPRIKALPSVVLKTRLSQFWRHQADSPRWYLATIEAIHQFLVELDAAQWRLENENFQEKSVKEETKPVENRCVYKEIETNISNIDSDSKSSEVILNVSCDKDMTCESNQTEECSSKTYGLKDINNGDESMKPVRSPNNNNKVCVNDQYREYIYKGDYDNLLFFFRFMYSKIHTLYDHDQLRSYKRRLE